MKTPQSGFTLFELLLTVAIAALLLGIGAPGLRDFVRNSRMSAAANDIISDLSVARTEAVKRRVPVTLCKSTNGTSCDTAAGNQLRRWIIFVDDADPGVGAAADGDGDVDAGEVVLRDRSIADTLTVYTNVDAHRVLFETTGFPRTGVENLTAIRLCDERKNAISIGGQSAARAIQIQPTGRAAVTRDIARITTLGGCP